MTTEEKFEGEKRSDARRSNGPVASWSSLSGGKLRECGFHYRKRKSAERCEEYCREHGLCNSDTTRKSIERGG